MKTILIILISINSIMALELKDFKIRARENFEWQKIKTKNSVTKFKGLSNTFNIWYERPYDFSIGIAYSSLFSGIKTKDVNSPFGKDVNLYNIGLESKYFPKIIFENTFIRTGLAYTILDPKNGPSLTGVNIYLGLGYEIPFESFGLALELGYRKAFLEENTEVEVIIPSIGVHFYEYF